jgi:hypothetical protein
MGDAASATPPSRIAGAQNRITHVFIIVACALPDADRIQGRQEPRSVLRLFLKTIAFASLVCPDFALLNHSPEDNWDTIPFFRRLAARNPLRSMLEAWCSTLQHEAHELHSLSSRPVAAAPARYATVGVWFESVAQLVEHRPFKALVVGSSPTALTIKHPINIGYLDDLHLRPH